MKHAHILLLLPCGMLPPLAGAQRTEPPGRFSGWLCRFDIAPE